MESSAVSRRRQDNAALLSSSMQLRPWGWGFLLLGLPGLRQLVALLLGLEQVSALSVVLAVTVVAVSLVVLFSISWCKRQARRVILERIHPAEVRSREQFRVILQVSLEGRSPITGLIVSDEFSAGETPGGEAFSLGVLAPGQKVRCAYAALCPASRGWQRLTRSILLIEDPLGLIQLTAVRKLTTEFLVLPRAQELDSSLLLGSGAWVGSEASRVQESGIGEEFIGTREYRPGDRYRDIHWKSSARSGVLVVRENARLVRADLLVLLHLFRPAPWTVSSSGLQEARESMGTMEGVGPALDLAIEAAASCVRWGWQAGYRTSFWLAGLQPYQLDGIESEAGILAILRQLAVAEPQSTLPLAEVLAAVLPRLSRGSSVVVIVPSDSVRDPRAREVLLGLRHRVSEVKLVLASPSPPKGWQELLEELGGAGIPCWVLQQMGDIRKIFQKGAIHGAVETRPVH